VSGYAVRERGQSTAAWQPLGTSRPNLSVRNTAAPKGTETDRGDWTQPLVTLGGRPAPLYYASQFLFKTTDGARTWTQISRDLTRPGSRIPSSLDATAAASTDRNGKHGVIYAWRLALRAPLGLDRHRRRAHPGHDRRRHVGGRDVTTRGAHCVVSSPGIEASHFDADHGICERSTGTSSRTSRRTSTAPRDQGRSWQPITTGLRMGLRPRLRRRVAPRVAVRRTERGGVRCRSTTRSLASPLQRNLRATSVRDFVVYGNDLIVATHGRGSGDDDITRAAAGHDAVPKPTPGSSGPGTPSTVIPGDETAHRSSATSHRR